MLLKELRILQAASARRMQGLAEAAAEAGRQAGEKGRGAAGRRAHRQRGRREARRKLPKVIRPVPAVARPKRQEAANPGMPRAPLRRPAVGVGRHGRGAQRLHAECG